MSSSQHFPLPTGGSLIGYLRKPILACPDQTPTYPTMHRTMSAEPEDVDPQPPPQTSVEPNDEHANDRYMAHLQKRLDQLQHQGQGPG